MNADPDRRPPDLRLVPAALAAWAATVVGLQFGPIAAAVLTGLSAAAAVAVRTRRPVLLAAAGCAAAAGLVVTAHTMVLVQHPLRAAAEAGAAATLRVVTTDDPRRVRTGVPGEAQVLVPAVLQHADSGDGSWDTGGRVLLIASGPDWPALLPGQALTAQGLLAPATRSDLTVAVLRVRGPPGDVVAPPWWQTAAGSLRAGLRDATAALPDAPGGLLPGLAVGDTTAMTTEVEDDFRAAGLSHLTAVSGDTACQTGV